MMERFVEIWPHVVAALTLATTLFTSGHALVYKRDPRSAVGWVGVIWLVPLLGAIFYVLFGINRIRRRASRLRQKRPQVFGGLEETTSVHRLEGQRPPLAAFVDGVVDRSLLEGGAFDPLQSGDETYPAMLEAIAGATETINLSTYIFDNDAAGKRFRDALGQAVARGVEVRVIVDAMGARYTFPTIIRPLRKVGVRVARFLPTLVPRLLPYANLRSHRKIMVVDGRLGFTGGINIRHGHLVKEGPRHPVRDLHFRVRGPIVSHLQEAFLDDWLFSTGERLEGDRFFPPLEPAGPVLARGITDGPDEDLDKLRWAILGALACARRRVRIVTPYFLPDTALVVGLNTAALRGVDVEVLLPADNNLRIVKWACDATLWQVLERGVKVYEQAPPFDHSKLMVVDDEWALLGSANWDPRSLRLNFEFNVECYDKALCARLNEIIDDKKKDARPVTLADVDARPLPVKIRDGIARLFSPYL